MKTPAPKYPAAKSRFGREFDLVDGQTGALCLCVFNREDQKPYDRATLTDEEFTEIWRRSIQPGALPLKDFIAAALREKMASAERFDAEMALESALMEAIGLIDILVSKLIADADSKMFPSLPGYDFETCQTICGLQKLSFRVRDGLLAGLRSDSKQGKAVAA